MKHPLLCFPFWKILGQRTEAGWWRYGPPVPMEVGSPPCQTAVGSTGGGGCALDVRAGVGAGLRCLVAGPEDNKKIKCEVFSSETLKEQLGGVSWAEVYWWLEFGDVEYLEVKVINATRILRPQPKWWPGRDEKQIVEGHWEWAASKECKKRLSGEIKSKKRKSGILEM